ncbi:TRAP transporter large permease [Marinobacterium arenosum]|uniref:TRAP transporter large permease n=1 Tax=Marinobacterium arenosum TaxID=2862496 RepID=UPI001C9887C3|nr:TRAP transporter large permease [Marinobacterium arenosum]MBY4677205.1 TRAP transporter large permease [Marinobacterium arenosum]
MLSVIALSILILALIIGVPVPFAFLGSTTFLIFFADYDPSFLLPFGFSRMSNSVLLAIPLFIIAGGLINRGHIGDKLVELIDLFVGRIKGGMGVVTVISCAVFGSITGSAAATLSGIGAIMFPKLNKAGYPAGHSAALIANASVLGLLIPPSAIMILYAWIGNQSVLAAFLATVVPGIILTLLLCLVNVVLVRKHPELVLEAPLDRKAFRQQLARRSSRAVPALAMPFLILGGIYSGFVTPTEAAALGVLYAIPVGFFIYRGLNGRSLVQALLEAAVTTGVIMVMLYTVMILSRLYIMEDLPGTIMDALTSVTENPLLILLMINLFMVVIGMLMDDASAVLLSTPILLPLIMQLDVSPIQFAAIVGVNLGMGNITPPTAPLLYLGGQLNGARIDQMMKPTLCMIAFAWLPTLLLVTYVPQLSLWLPGLVLGIE